MTLEMLLVFALLALAVVLFTSEVVSFDIAALIPTGILLLTGVLTPAEGFAGFSNAATVTIGAMFVLSAGIHRTGTLNVVSDYFIRLGKSRYYVAILLMMLAIGVISAFVNNTAAVAIFIPVVIETARALEESPSKLLMPFSFAAMFGGVCTLIGTSTNILVSSMAENRGEAAFSMFEFLPLGIVFFVVGIVYLMSVGIRLVPPRRREDLTSTFEMQGYLTDVELTEEAVSNGDEMTIERLTQDLDVEVLNVFRGDGVNPTADPHRRLYPGDVIRMRGSVDQIDRLLRHRDVRVLPTDEWRDVDLKGDEKTLVEAVVAPESSIEGLLIRDLGLDQQFDAAVLAMRHRGRLQNEAFGRIRVSAGDSLLLLMDRDDVDNLERDPSFVVVSEVLLPRIRPEKTPVALAILAGVVGTAALGLFPIVVSATCGAVLMVLTGCLTSDDVYDAVNWKVIFLLAGVIPLGLAMDKTGAAHVLAEGMLAAVGDLGPRAVVSGFFLVSMLLTNFISNQATAALLVPLAFSAAATLDVSPRPLLVAVTFAASLSFMTPVGYQTNTLIYGPGQYRFTDFTKVGTPLNLVFWILATMLIPVFWPL